MSVLRKKITHKIGQVKQNKPKQNRLKGKLKLFFKTRNKQGDEQQNKTQRNQLWKGCNQKGN